MTGTQLSPPPADARSTHAQHTPPPPPSPTPHHTLHHAPHQHARTHTNTNTTKHTQNTHANTPHRQASPDLAGPLTVIDFEYGSYGHRGFDVGNHFNEYAGFECDYAR